MCGLVGYWNRDGRPAHQEVLGRMSERIRSRGPDDHGTWTRGSVGLALRRLSILDLSERGHQPFVTADGQGVIAYNGEVYNYRVLRDELARDGVAFHSTSDTEVVLYALHRWGPEAAVRRFDGMFGFAYYDLRTGTLWLARDRMGMKPLFVTDTGSAVVFASEIKALFEHPDVVKRPDMHALTTQMVYGRLDGTWTVFEGIQSLVPGSLMKVSAAGIETTQYFDVMRDVDVARIVGHHEPLAALEARTEALVRASVTAHLVSDAPLAVMCSGGIDSSLLCAYVRQAKQELTGYVADIKGVPVPEVDRAQTVCDHLGITLRQVPIDREDFVRMLPLAVWQNDQPSYYPQNVAVMAITKAARADGFKVLLAGEGGDELFGGYRWQVRAYNMWRLRRLHAALVPNLGVFRALGALFSKLTPVDLDELAKRPFTPIAEWPGLGTPPRLLCAIGGGRRVLREKALFRKLAPLGRHEDRAFVARSLEDCYRHLSESLTSSDRMSMANSVEVRFPFLGNDVIDFGLHLPMRAKYHRRTTKYLLKRAAAKVLPASIIRAKKIGFQMVEYSWRHTDDLLKGGVLADMFRWRAEDMDELMAEARTESLFVFHLLSMELWARMQFRGETPDALSEQLLRMVTTG